MSDTDGETPTTHGDEARGVNGGPGWSAGPLRPGGGAVGRSADSARGEARTHRPRHGGRKRLSYRVYKRHRRIVWILVFSALAVVIAAGWVGLRVWQAYRHLEAAAEHVQVLSQNLKDGDTDAATATLSELQAAAGAAHSEAHDFLWGMAEHLPAIGPNLQAVRTIADAIDTLSWQTVPPLVKVASGLTPAQIAPKGGAIDLAPLQAAAPDVEAAAAAVHSLRANMAAIDRGPLLSPVARAVTDLDAKLTSVGSLAETAVKAVKLLPPMLGAEGKRTYLVVFQNLAELRATGGVFGAYAIITADHGKITLAKQGATGTDLRQRTSPVPPLTEQQRALYTDRLGSFVADTNLSPDFPTAAHFLRAMYHQRFGVVVDGVVATDPVALADILSGTGPVKLPNGTTLNTSNAVHYLLSASYGASTSIQASRQSDATFDQATVSVFNALTNGHGSAKATMAGLVTAAANHRLLVWSANAAEQRVLSATVLGGVLPADDGSIPTVGVFLNDGTGGKMDYYLRQTISLNVIGCRGDHRAVLHVRTTLTSTAPAAGLPPYVLGMELGGPYVTRTNVMFFSPTGGAVEGATVNQNPTGIGGGTERGRAVGTITVDLKPGETKTIDATILTAMLPATGLTGARVRATPMSTATAITIDRTPACAYAGP